jgi:hypothetical protein
LSSIARKIAKNVAKRAKAQPAKRIRGLTSSFESVEDLRAAYAAATHPAPRLSLGGDRSAEAARRIAGAMASVQSGYQDDGSYVCGRTGVHMSKAYQDNLQTNKPVLEGKGEKGQRCNRTACQAPGAYWYNHSTRAYYCGTCAELINAECAQDSYTQGLGHSLLTLDPEFADKAGERL